MHHFIAFWAAGALSLPFTAKYGLPSVVVMALYGLLYGYHTGCSQRLFAFCHFILASLIYWRSSRLGLYFRSDSSPRWRFVGLPLLSFACLAKQRSVDCVDSPQLPGRASCPAPSTFHVHERVILQLHWTCVEKISNGTLRTSSYSDVDRSCYGRGALCSCED